MPLNISFSLQDPTHLFSGYCNGNHPCRPSSFTYLHISMSCNHVVLVNNPLGQNEHRSSGGAQTEKLRGSVDDAVGPQLMFLQLLTTH